jgi:hypothetical protein
VPRLRGGALLAPALILPLAGAALFPASSLVFDSLWRWLLGGLFVTIFLNLTPTDIDRSPAP